jgi:hypothetical protein
MNLRTRLVLVSLALVSWLRAESAGNPAALPVADEWPMPKPADERFARIKYSIEGMKFGNDVQPMGTIVRAEAKMYELKYAVPVHGFEGTSMLIETEHDYEVKPTKSAEGVWVDDLSSRQPWDAPVGVRCFLHDGATWYFKYVNTGRLPPGVAPTEAKPARIHLLREGGIKNKLWWPYVYCDDAPLVRTHPATHCTIRIAAGTHVLNTRVNKQPLTLEAKPDTDYYFKLIGHMGMTPKFEFIATTPAEFAAAAARAKPLDPAKIDPRVR